jgi:RNase P subunit RPR2
MVKVVQVAPAKRTTCYNCRAILEYEFSDITKEYQRDWDGGGDTYYRITCPNCQLKNNVPLWR